MYDSEWLTCISCIISDIVVSTTTESDSGAAIGGAVAGGVIVIGAVVVSLIVLLAVLAHRQKKTKSHVPGMKDFDNPVYEGKACFR